MYLNYNLVQMGRKYADNKISDGNWYREKFEKMHDANPEYTIDW